MLASAVALALVSAAAADYSGTDRGLKPTVLEAFDRVHYYQIPDDPVGTVVSAAGGRRAAVEADCSLSWLGASCQQLVMDPWVLISLPAAHHAGFLPRLRSQRPQLLSLRRADVPQLHR